MICRYCGRDLQAPKFAQLSLWKRSAMGAVVLTFLSTCGLAVYVNNEFEAVKSLAFDVPITFVLWWFVCTFLVWIWGRIAMTVLYSQLVQWLRDLLS